MFKMSDSASGLSLCMTIDPQPRNPRLVNDNVFQIVTWTKGLGDPHAWPDRQAFLDAFPAETNVLFPVRALHTRKGPVLVRVYSNDDPIDGYAFATHERLCIAFGLDKITGENHDDMLEEADTLCLTELQDYEHFVDGDVYRFEITDKRGECVETARDLYGEGYARHVAQDTLDKHLYSVAMDG